jgi:hypothetical protein
MVPYSAYDQTPGFDAYLLTIANELLTAADPQVQERGKVILHSMRTGSQATVFSANSRAGSRS